ncbi:MAG TPA: hypothetical protein PK869_00950 [Candidatus Hydrogenedentes bacterium]|mgnify:CR=1|nr:hypothetical protein [Candidatus Hydrogenedentota bacterium]
MNIKPSIRALALAVLVFLGTACPPGGPTGDTDYDVGYAAGFLRDDFYWDGYFDGWDTIDVDPAYYDDSDIPFIDDGSYDAGYWDGVWYAYNDGYFVDYQYAFVIGFSEGYDNAYWDDYLDFLDFDEHLEFVNGGWSDGYHDGYSEGRVFGASDYEEARSFDWLDALLDYQSGTDLYFDEVDVGTGIYGPVELYEYGTNPNTLKKAAKARMRSGSALPAIRTATKGTTTDFEWFRPFDEEAADLLDYAPLESLRDSIELRLTTTWLERVEEYVAFSKSTKKTAAAEKSAPRARVK